MEARAWSGPTKQTSEAWLRAAVAIYDSATAPASLPDCPSCTRRVLFTICSSANPARGDFHVWCPDCRIYDRVYIAVPPWWSAYEPRVEKPQFRGAGSV